MKLALYAAAALALAGQTATALASPTVRLSAVAPAYFGVISSKPGCNAAAGVKGTPYAAMPSIAAFDVTGVSRVEIRLTAEGNLAGEQLFSSSGSGFLDEAALESAESAQYTSEVRDCKHVSGAYLYEVDF